MPPLFTSRQCNFVPQSRSACVISCKETFCSAMCCTMSFDFYNMTLDHVTALATTAPKTTKKVGSHFLSSVKKARQNFLSSLHPSSNKTRKSVNDVPLLYCEKALALSEHRNRQGVLKAPRDSLSSDRLSLRNFTNVSFISSVRLITTVLSVTVFLRQILWCVLVSTK